MHTRNEQSRSSCQVELTSREVTLLLKYGCPWPDVAARLRASRAVKGYHAVSLDAYGIEMMQADLVRSAQTLRSAKLLEEIDELCCALDAALRIHPRIDAISS